MKKNKDKMKRFSLGEQYVKSWKYIGESRNFICSIIIIFIVFSLIGFFISPSEEISNKILDYFKLVLEQTEDFNQFQMMNFILLNNLKSSFASIFFGFILGIVPFISTISNGYIFGFVSSMSVSQAGFSSLLNIFPHGIFELPSIFISLGIGLRFGSFIFNKDKYDSFRRYLREGLRVFVFVVVPLLIIAAIIESFLIIAS
jgi:stage II sporulation protein M